jgi:hypothetical protein
LGETWGKRGEIRQILAKMDFPMVKKKNVVYFLFAEIPTTFFRVRFKGRPLLKFVTAMLICANGIYPPPLKKAAALMRKVQRAFTPYPLRIKGRTETYKVGLNSLGLFVLSLPFESV